MLASYIQAFYNHIFVFYLGHFQLPISKWIFFLIMSCVIFSINLKTFIASEKQFMIKVQKFFPGVPLETK
jgi:hypothetical protein